MAEVVGRYELLEEIGHGGFAIVYRAHDTVLDRQVALKELRPVLLTNTVWIERFRREARTIARLDHPHIVPIYDVDEVDGRMFIVMRLVDGPNLKELVAERGKLPWGEAVEIIASVSEALAYAHGQGILHRDLKPANILLDLERGPLLSDFGMAKLVGEGTISVTGDVVGTPHYIAPEAWDGAAATIQTDIYALGCILYELLMGEKIFHGDTPLAVMSAHLKPLDLPENWPEGAPSGVDDVFTTSLARHPADRYATVGELIQALAALTTGEPLPPHDLLKISTLGGLQLTCAGEPVQEIGSRRVEALLVYLACTQHPQPREVLADLLWDDRPQKQAMSNLRTVLTGLRKHFGLYLTITRETVTLNAAANVWLDATALTESLPRDTTVSAESVTRIEQVVGLYRGDFLEGFHLRGARNFEEWLTVERENLRQQVLDALDGLIAYHLAQGSYKAGIAHARHLLQLDPLLEEAHQQLMRLLAYSGQRPAALAQYEACRQLLAEEFGVEPTAETTALFEEIQAGTLAIPPPIPTSVPDVSLRLPAFLQQKQKSTTAKAPPFVSRERQLAALNMHLESALAGDGRVVFVTGEAGRGKTALMTEFARRAQETHGDLIVASGNCNAYGGTGDPYLPFRDVLGMLSGDVESKWAAGSISRDYAKRLWALLPQTGQALVDVGPDLLNVFVAGPSLLERARAASANETAWYSELKALVENGRVATHLEQQQLFEQYLQVLQALTRQAPLLLWLDDLQWADDSSLNLLFHLGRRLPGNRILIVGAFRPSEVILKRPVGVMAEQQHPLQPVVNEFKRLFGDIQLDLGQIPAAENQAFVEALLDSEPNQLRVEFRKALFEHTKGHPLFTIELLRDLQARGDLIQDEAAQWIEGTTLNWDTLPTRVEAVIEQRLSRLGEALQEILSMASVEGEIFTVQIVARLLDMSERQVLRRLSRELERRHRLVQEQGEVTVGDRRLTRYRFTHILFQHYLYNQLSQTERRLLHGDMAEILEEFYAGQTDQVATQLARHYVEAGENEKALVYLLQAGDQARLAYAHETAIAYYRQALTILKEQGDIERAARTLMKLGLTYHNAFEYDESRLAYEEGFRLWQEGGQSQRGTLSSAGQVLRLVSSTIPTLDPTQAGDNESGNIIVQLFSGLVTETAEMEVVPDVAQRWEISADGLQYVFYLRDDVVWSDGSQVTAADFTYGWKRVLNPQTGLGIANLLYDIKGAEAFHQGRVSDPDAVGVFARDKTTLVVELERPASYFLQLLTHYTTYPVPRHVVEKYGDSWIQPDHIVTNGPFKLQAWHSESPLILERNPAYHGQFKGNVRRIDISVFFDWSPVPELYETDQLDIMISMEALSLADQEYLQRHHPEEYICKPSLSTRNIAFNVQQPPFDDVRVRRALAMAINKTKLSDVKSSNVVPATGGYVPPNMPGHSAGIGPAYDPEQARQLLAEAGYPNGEGFPVVTWLTGWSTTSTCQDLQQQWHDILGVDLKWDRVAWVEYRTTLDRVQPHIFMDSWVSDYPDPDNFLRVGIPRQCGWHNEVYTELVEKARRLMDHEERMKLYAQADRLLMVEAVIIPLYHRQLRLLAKPWLKNVHFTPSERPLWKDVVIEASLKPPQSKPATSPKPALRTLGISWCDPDTLDPAKANWAAEGLLLDQLFSGLVVHTPQLEVVPHVAYRWDISSDGCHYTFHLRNDVRWSDGMPVRARDFEFAWKRLLNPATGGVDVDILCDIKGARAFHQGEVSNPSDVKVIAIDEFTLTVELESPTSYFLHLITNSKVSPVPQHIVERYGDRWTDLDYYVTNGPFKIEAWEQGSLMVLTPNPHYQGAVKGNVEQVKLYMVTDWSDRLALYEAGTIDIMNMVFLPWEAKDRLKRQHSEEYYAIPLLGTDYVGFNAGRPPFDDIRIRRAFALSLDQTTFSEKVFEGLEPPATGGLVPPGIPGHSSGIGLTYDLEQAQQLLDQAGYPNGRDFPLLQGLTNKIWQPQAEYLSQWWQETLGVEISWRFVEDSAYIDQLTKQKPCIFVNGWLADYPDPHDFLEVGLAGEPLGWRNETYKQLVKEARRVTDQEIRMNLYQQVDQILLDEAAIIPLTYGRLHGLKKPWVKGLAISATQRWFWQDITLEPH